METSSMQETEISTTPVFATSDEKIAWAIEKLRAAGIEGSSFEDMILEAVSQLELMNAVDWSAVPVRKAA